MRKRIFSFVLAATMVMSLAACGGGDSKETAKDDTTKAAAETKEGDDGTQAASSGGTGAIKFALIGPLTGNNAYAGEAMFNGAKMVIDEYNEAGGYNGTPVEYVEYDTKADANEGTMIAQKLATDDSVTATIGPWSSTVGLAMAPIIDDAGLIMYATSPSHADLTKSSEWIIRQTPLAATLAYGCADTLLEAGYTNGVYLYDNTNEGATKGSELFEERFTTGGGTVTVEGYAAGTKDFTPLMTKYKSQGIEFICMYGATADSALICTQARDMDLDCLIQVNSMALNDEFNELIAGLEEVYCCDSYAADYPDDAFQEFVSKYESLYGEKPIVHGYFGYCAAKRLLDTIEEYGLDDMTKVRDALRNGTQETELGTLEFIDGDADRPTIWSKYDVDDGVFHAVTEIPSLK
ncbi:MAG: ABC transporter substrate-binding protein [Lachnospiraceae bacterium]|jgi:branched-chain amino acid transport system substrate-binding protein|nr:ABC transporter substrate-binding protein [Lachnospiraceae bacterium]